MINLDLNEIEEKTSTVLRYPNYSNWYSWKEIKDITKDHEFKDVPLFDVPISELQEAGKLKVLYSSSFIGYVCFGRFTVDYHRRGRANVSRILFDVAPYRVLKNAFTNNYCWMNEEQLNFWISTVHEESELDFYYKIETSEDRYHILLDFKQLNKTQIKYILFWIRYAFEQPASFCALDAMLLKRDYYPEETMQNLLTLTGVCQRNNPGLRIHPSQCITVNGNFITRDALRNKLNTARSVQNMFGHPDFAGYEWEWNNGSIYETPIKSFLGRNTYSGKDWIKSEKRFDSYTKIYEVLKKHEIKTEEGN